MIKRCNLYYRSWKYWHAAKNHFLALAIVIAYEIQKEILNDRFEDFGLTKQQAGKLLLGFFEFRKRLSEQGLQYDRQSAKYTVL